jgi:hypothetical protein
MNPNARESVHTSRKLGALMRRQAFGHDAISGLDERFIDLKGWKSGRSTVEGMGFAKASDRPFTTSDAISANQQETCICPGEFLATGAELPCSDGLCPGQLMERWCEDIARNPLHGALNFTRMCPDEQTDEADTPSLRAASATEYSRLLERRSVVDEQILDDVEREIEQLDEVHASKMRDAFDVFQKFAAMNANDVLAFQESWTDADTAILRRLDNTHGGFVENASLDTEAFIAKLPKWRQLSELIERHPTIAVVGSGSALENAGLGKEIDAHSAVVRFNGLVRHFLRWVDTGRRTTLHVFNAMVKPLDHEEVEAVFDLETNTPGRTYCSRLHKGGEMEKYKLATLFFIRPTAYCKMPEEISQFSRGFMFYWLVGRLFQQRDMYGFKGTTHYNATRTNSSLHNPNISSEHEAFIPFEHLLYKTAERVDSLKADASDIKSLNASAVG